MLSGRSQLVLLFPSLPVPLPILWELFQEHQLQLVSTSPSCSIVCLFFFNFLARSRYLSLLSLSFYSFESFSHKRYLMIFRWGLSDSICPQIFRTLLSILIDLSNAVVLMISTYPLISQSSSSFNNPFAFFHTSFN